MFGKMKDMMSQFQMMQTLMKDENFKALMAHPKVQELLGDPEFQAMMKSGNMENIATHPKFSSLRGDRELMEIISKLNRKK